MHHRFWLWIGVRLLGATVIVALLFSSVKPGGGEREFRTTLEAVKHVRTFRALTTSNPGTRLNDMLWELDCDQRVMHKVTHTVDTSVDPPVDMTRDELRTSTLWYTKQSDGQWKQTGFSHQGGSPQWYCEKLGEGTDYDLLPKIATMIRLGIIQKGEQKTVNGVRCREWNVASRNGTVDLEHATVCIGVDDHLPYEVTVDWERSRTTFSDYNAPLSFDLPNGVAQSANATN